MAKRKRKRFRHRLSTIAQMVGAFFVEYLRQLAADSPRERRRIERSVATIFPYTPLRERPARR